MLERLRQKSWEFSKKSHVGCSLAVSHVLSTSQLYKVSLAGSPHEHLLILHSHTQPGNFILPSLLNMGTSGLLLSSIIFVQVQVRHRQIYLRVASLVLFQFGKWGTSKAFRLERQKSTVEQCPWGLSGNRNGKEV